MNFLSAYKSWIDSDYFDAETKKELIDIKDDYKEIEDRFYKDLEFGTGGLRGIIGAGTNRMNIYTIRKTSQGLANYILKKGEKAVKKGIVIAFDPRHKSPEFAMEAAKVFAGNGIKAYVFDELRPTPELSFAVRYLKTVAGVIVTASHNPRQYNGYKVYGEDGAQLDLDDSDAVIYEVEKIEDISKVTFADKDEAIKSGMIKIIGKEIDDNFINSLKTLSLNREVIKKMSDALKIVYTPLHGTGNKPVRRILNEMGFKNVLVVKEQELPDPDFSTVKSPNPEEKDSLKLAMDLAQKNNADVIIATDPDCDRVGVGVKNANGEYVILSGNQTGCLLQEYVLSQKHLAGTLPSNGFTVKTIVTSELARAISDYYHLEVQEVLTGFKFIGERIKTLDEFGTKKFVFGFEESFGYLAGTFVRDKDGVVTSMLVCEMTAYYKSRGMTVYEGLEEIFKKYGYYVEGLTSFNLEGKDGIEQIEKTMDQLRMLKCSKFGEVEAIAIRDYSVQERIDLKTGETSRIELPKSNVLYYEMGGDSWFCIRPSGTEPKIKIYYGISDKSKTLAENKLENLKQNVVETIKKILF